MNSGGVVMITDSLLSGNGATNTGGALSGDGLLTMTNTTVSGNTANSFGGGLRFNGGATLLNSTITNNHSDNDDSGAENGGGISTAAGAITLRNTIISGNFRGSGRTTADDVGGGITANYSFIGTTAGATITGDNNVNGDPLLGPLATNGGPTMTHALLTGSPARNAGDPVTTGLPANDQRGSPWVRVASGRVDLGAFEAQSFNLVVDTTADMHQDGRLTLREAIAMANTNPDADNITIAPALSGQTITLGSGELVLTDTNGATTITGPTGGVTITGNNASRVLTVDNAALANLSNLTITGGFSDIGASGGILNFGTLNLNNVTVTGNQGVEGAGIYSTGALTISNSTISNNTASDFGGGGINSTGSLMVTNSTVSGNSAPFGGGIMVFPGSTATLTGTTVSGNTATTEQGGGFYAVGSLSLINSTVSGNRAAQEGGGIATFGPLDLLNVTVTDNHSDNNNSGGETGGGVYAGQMVGYGTFTTNVVLRNTIVSGNYRGSATTTSDNIGGLSAASVTANYSLFSDVSGVTVLGSNNVSGNALLGSLADNGGPTLTHALLANSPANNAGNNVLVPAEITTDQRGLGFPRLVGTVDIGAFESAVQLPPTRSFDFNSGVNTEPDYIGVVTTDLYTTARGYGWDQRGVLAKDTGSAPASGPSGSNALLRDAHFYSRDRTFRADVAPGHTYQVTFLGGDATRIHDRIQLAFEGSTTYAVNELSGSDLMTAAANTWVVGRFTVTDNGDGILDIRFHDGGGSDSNWHVNALTLRPMGAVIPVTFSGPASSPADGLGRDEFTGTATGLPDGARFTVHAVQGTADPADDVEPLVPGVQVALSGGRFTFHVLRPAGTGGTPAEFRVTELHGRAGGSLMHTYTVPEVRRFDFNAAGSPTATGFLGVRAGTTYSISTGYGWTAGVLETSRSTGSDLRRDNHFWTDATFRIEVKAGVEYRLRLYLGDAGYGHDRIGVYLEGATDPAYVVESLGAGVFDVRVTSVTSVDNTLSIRLRDLGGTDPNFAITGLDLWEATAAAPDEQL